MRADTILQTIGNTPHIRIQRLFGPAAQVWIKSERSNPGGSITFPLTLTVKYAPSAPVITTQPASITIPAGTTGTLSASAYRRGIRRIRRNSKQLGIWREKLTH